MTDNPVTFAYPNSYDVILADPPWTFSVWNAEKSDRHVSHKYPLMSIDDICNLPVFSLAADNCALFLWATWPNLLDALKVISAWGKDPKTDPFIQTAKQFEYKTLGFEWVKLNESGLGFHIGMGYYTRANSEPCLLAVKGNMPVSTHSERNLLISPIREHSRKPDEQYGKIERLYPGRRYLELFARRKRSGWSAWGNEVESDIEIPLAVQP